ncbi:MAG: glutaredoxin family protein [Proteobacteria bacterium]|nr:glutaredoxin family protein [Pseudomonadota bacterium]
MEDRKIIVYSLSTCGHCRDTIKFIREKGVDFSFIDIDLLEKQERMKVLDEIKKINPECSFPTTVAGDRTVVGFNEELLEEALNI